MLDKEDFKEDTKNIKLIDKPDSSNCCCSYLLECLFIVCC